MKFELRECAVCGASHAWPLIGDDAVYERIYKQISLVPGYNRYDHYAREVLRQRDALSYLSDQEETYWAVAEHLRAKSRGARVLEVGCGLGYFTFAMLRAGFDAFGVDVSTEAIASAIRNYGKHYAVKSLAELKADSRRYDVVVMNQLIEHLVDVHSFVSNAVELLARGGDLVITTPNKSAFPGAQWETDLPPVHLWWFSENSMHLLARRHGCAVTFVDFSEYVDAHFRPKGDDVGPVRLPILDENGKVITEERVRPGHLKRWAERFGMLERLRTFRGTLTGRQRWRGSRGPVMAAVFNKV